jgi:hypothetical protein
MSSWNFRVPALVLAVVLLFGIGCSGTQDNPTAPSADPSPEMLTVSLTPVTSVLNSLDLLSCKPLPYASATAVVGPEGGIVRVGKTNLVIPRFALRSAVAIKAEQVSGSVNSVRFSPEGLRFAKPATLTMSYDNCLLVLPTKRIVYTTEGLRVLEILQSLDLRLTRTVSASIEHFSRYAVAY